MDEYNLEKINEINEINEIDINNMDILYDDLSESNNLINIKNYNNNGFLKRKEEKIK